MTTLKVGQAVNYLKDVPGRGTCLVPGVIARVEARTSHPLRLTMENGDVISGHPDFVSVASA